VTLSEYDLAIDIDAYVTHGPQAGRLEFLTWAALPTSRAKTRRLTRQE